MTTDTVEAEDEMTARRFHSIEEMILFHNPQWQYLVNATLDVRPPTDAEAAAYAARHEDADWAELYNPAEPRIILPPSAPEITALMEPVAEGEPGVLTGEVVPEEPYLADIQQEGIATLSRWAPGVDTGHLSAVRDEPEPELHHDTQVLHITPEASDE